MEVPVSLMVVVDTDVAVQQAQKASRVRTVCVEQYTKPFYNLDNVRLNYKLNNNIIAQIIYF